MVSPSFKGRLERSLLVGNHVEESEVLLHGKTGRLDNREQLTASVTVGNPALFWTLKGHFNLFKCNSCFRFWVGNDIEF